MDKYKYWTDVNGRHLEVKSMRTSHIINCLKLINKMAEQEDNYDYPKCYDNMYIELNTRGVDTDWEMDSYFPKL